VIRLLALDLDGTLMGDDLRISAPVKGAVAAAQERGVVVTLATGRMFDVALPFARELNITAPMICYQGGVIQAADAAEPLYRAEMDPVPLREVMALAVERDWHMVLYADDQIFIAEQRYEDDLYTKWLGDDIRQVGDLSSVLDGHVPSKFLIVAYPPEADRIEVEVRDRFADRMEIVRSHELFVEGNPQGVSKGDALRRLAAHLDVPQAEVMAVGDQGNDATMIAWAGVGVVMGDGSPVVQAVADWVAPPLAEDGAAVAIERFILNPRP